VRAGWRIEIQRQGWGWAYLAIAGGIDVPLVLGSRSTYLRGKFGGLAGRSLTSGDLLPIGAAPLRAETAWRDMPAPTYADTLTADVLLGPQRERFTEAGIAQFLDGVYTITPSADRMGYRLEGPPIAHQSGADITSDAIALGTLQVPASGQPILMMSDHGTTGGYTKIATMATLDVWRVAQCAPERGRVRFRPVAVEDAQLLYRRVLGTLSAQVIDGWQEVMPW
jgi:antagonist of KipI